MSKKSIRVAIDLHERLALEGVYGVAVGDDRKPIFDKELSVIEPQLMPCPFCSNLPTFNPSTIRGGGVSANYYGASASIECGSCDLLFKGHYGEDVCNQWNFRAKKAQQG